MINKEGKVDKSWGYELIFSSNDLYCGKLLVFTKKNAKFSMHFHKTKDESWLIEQYNRNRDAKDHIDDVNDIPKDYSDEFNQKIKKARDVLDELQGFMKVTGGEFRQWFDNLSERAKDMYRNEYKEKK